MKKLLLGLAFITVANADDAELKARVTALEDFVFGKHAKAEEPTIDILDENILPAAVEPNDEVKAEVAAPKLSGFQMLVKAYMEAGVLGGGASKVDAEAAKAERDAALSKVKDAFKRNPKASCSEFVAYVAGDAQINAEKFGNILNLLDLSPQLATKGNADLIKGIKSGISMRTTDEKGTYRVAKRHLTDADICASLK